MDFTEELETSFIPRIKEMIAKEEKHIDLLKKSKHLDTKFMIASSELFISTLQIKLKEYENYILTHKTI